MTDRKPSPAYIKALQEMEGMAAAVLALVHDTNARLREMRDELAREVQETTK